MQLACARCIRVLRRRIATSAESRVVLQELEEHESHLWAQRGMFCVGALMAGMGVMNALQTMKTVAAKRRSGGLRSKRTTQQQSRAGDQDDGEGGDGKKTS